MGKMQQCTDLDIVQAVQATMVQPDSAIAHQVSGSVVQSI